MPPTRVRVRGIAATAISRILLDKGYSIVQASRIICERLGLEHDPSPADVTVKDSGEDELLVLGFYGHADRVFEDLAEELGDVFRWASPVGLYSVHVGKIIDKSNDTCIVEICNGQRGVLPRCGHELGKLITVSVVHPAIKPYEEIRFSREIRVVGEYVSLIHGSPRITVSEHIRDRDKRSHLVALATSKLIGSGLGIHLRSSAKYAGDEEIVEEIDRLKKVLTEIVEKTRNTDEVEMIYPGEFIGLLGLTSTAKQRLDEYRGRVIPTIRNHHSYKTIGGWLSELVDYTEKLIEYGLIDSDRASMGMERYCLEKLVGQQIVKIIHVSPHGKRLVLTPGRITNIEQDENMIIIKRIMKSPGIYDGLDEEKKPGDIDYVVIRPGEWWISHNYYRGDEWLGTYININSPPEILPGIIKYHDLAIDVIVKKNNVTEIIDEDELRELHEKKIIPGRLYEKALETAKRIAENPVKYTYTPTR